MKKLLLIPVIAVLSIGAITFANDNTTEEVKTPEAVQVENNETQPTAEETIETSEPTPTNQPNQEEYKTLKNDRTGDTITTSEKVSQPTASPTSPTESANEPSAPSEPDPRTITSVQTVDGTPTDKNPNPLRTCNYTLQTGETAVVKQSNTTPCYGVGDILPRY